MTIDGSYGEGGGQVLRTALTLAAITGQAVRVEKIRAGRRNPGLQAQHLTGVLATARICEAALEGATLGSTTLTFVPRKPPQAGEYRFDVSEQRKGGSAGSVTLVLHTLILPLAFAEGPSRVVVRGGTHVAWSPPYHHLEQVYLPMLGRLGVQARSTIIRWGWYPEGGGEVAVEVAGEPHLELAPLQLEARGALRRLWGISACSNLPEHVARRQKSRAEEMLRQAGFSPRIECWTSQRGGGIRSSGTGSILLLFAECEAAVAGFSALGERGKLAERVAEEAVEEFLQWWESGAAVDRHLADQLLLPLCLARGPSSFTTCQVTEHLLTNAWVIQHFLPVQIGTEGEKGAKGRVVIRPR
ncbi:MAG: RNA 3'-terminal phosphate cyclase [Chloroflexia bacterium]